MVSYQTLQNFSWPFEEQQSLWKHKLQFHFIFTECVQFNFEGELIISPLCTVFLAKKNQFVSLQTYICWGQQTQTNLRDDMVNVFLAFKSNTTLHGVAFKIPFLAEFAA